jgi:acetoacetyl-CoA synthetase
VSKVWLGMNKKLPAIPITVTGKVSEAAVRATIHGQTLLNDGALANPEALRYFQPQELPELGE